MRQSVVLFLFLEAANICPEGRTVDSVVTVAALCVSSSKFRTPDTALLLQEEEEYLGVEGGKRMSRRAANCLSWEQRTLRGPLPLF